MKKPNIVLIMADQHRADMLGCAGHPVVQTPRLDQLAAEGARFARANCQGPLCMPARASVLTENYVREHGVSNNTSEVAEDHPTFLHALQEAGYHTTCIGKMHLWTHEEGRMHASTHDMAPVLERYGFAETHETVGKLATVTHQTVYTDHLAERDLLETYRTFTAPRSEIATHRAGAERLPMYNVDPLPLPQEDYADTWTGDQAATWLEDYDREEPFFLWVGFPGPHDPWDAPAESRARYADADIDLPASMQFPDDGGNPAWKAALEMLADHSHSADLTPERIREIRRSYYSNISVIDDAVGRIVDALERSGRLEDTWIVYTSDHGEMMGEHRLLTKMVFYDPSVRVPLLMRPPGGMPERIVNDQVEHIDLPATLREAAGAPDLPTSSGRSLLPVIRDGEPHGRSVSVSQNFGFAMFETDHHKIVVNEAKLKPIQLFDRVGDPLEDHNLVNDPAYASVIEDLMATHVRPFLVDTALPAAG